MFFVFGGPLSRGPRILGTICDVTSVGSPLGGSSQDLDTWLGWAPRF